MKTKNIGITSAVVVLLVVVGMSGPVNADIEYSKECRVEIDYEDLWNWERRMYYDGEPYYRPNTIDCFWDDGDDVYFNVTARFENKHESNTFFCEWEIDIMQDELDYSVWGGDTSPVYNQSAWLTVGDVQPSGWSEDSFEIQVYNVPANQTIMVLFHIYLTLDGEEEFNIGGWWTFYP